MSLTKIINGQIYLITCLSLGATLFTLLQPRASAQTFFKNPLPTQINRLSTPQRLVIDPASQSEIFPGVYSNSGNAITESVSNPEDLLRPPQSNVIVNRVIPAFWQMRVPIDQVGRLRAVYEIRGANGTINAISNDQNSHAIVGVALQPLPIQEISRDDKTQTAVVQGGINLRLNLSQAESAGAYAGNLTVTVNPEN